MDINYPPRRGIPKWAVWTIIVVIVLAAAALVIAEGAVAVHFITKYW